MGRPQIMVTNDDGIFSPGLAAAVEAVADLADVLIAAPLTQQTGMGRAQYGNPDAKLEKVTLEIRGKTYEAFACDAAPARVVGHVLSVLPDYRPDLVVSGINYGENLGLSVTGSGTVGAALESACRGIPSIAASLAAPIHAHYNYVDLDWRAATFFLSYFTKLALEKGFPPSVDILKIDVPGAATEATPWRVTRLSSSRYYDRQFLNPHVNCLLGDSQSAILPSPDEPVDTDRYTTAVEQIVSVTPMLLDCTAYEGVAALESWR